MMLLALDVFHVHCSSAKVPAMNDDRTLAASEQKNDKNNRAMVRCFMGRRDGGGRAGSSVAI